MTLPLLGPMTLSGFAHSWFFLFLLVVAGLIAIYVVLQLARQKRMLRFANMELLESVAPSGPRATVTFRRCCWPYRWCCSPSPWPGRRTTSGFHATARWSCW
ncbi:aerotolerance regulator family protein [Mycobacterium ulcerans str. Harvey]|uniref:Aerotolerance regulator family protein n=1 Tax=Mycobacterium ulcerans str. Harvey TaxID=1299332 RepID=A0ABN0R255_MYCUL|nr:aerotolerance regulator family protein [Mycobacterium ulcerans str. Harvey]